MTKGNNYHFIGFPGWLVSKTVQITQRLEN